MRKSINNIITKILVVSTVFIVSACTTNFEDYNTPKDEPQGGFPGLYLKDMQMQILPAAKNKYQMNENLLGGAYGRYFASAQVANKAQFQTSFILFNPAYSWANSPFEETMATVYGNWYQVKSITKGEGVAYAWGQILRIAAMHRLTDIQGPIPYSAMGNIKGLETPYDDQETVYMTMFEDLDKAIVELTAYVGVNPSDRSYKSFDLVYGGDFSKWIKFANSLKLRMAMRISLVNSTKAKEYAEAAISHPYGVITSNEDNAAVDYKDTGDQNPLRWLVEDYQDVVAGAEIVTYMNSYADPRLKKYFNTPVSGTDYAGLRLGALSSLTWRNSYSLPKVMSTDKLMWISASEVAFLRAEMALNDGWNAGGTAQDFYEEAITLSFTQNDLSAEDAAGYYANSTLVPTNHTDARATPNLNYAPAIPYSVTIAWDDAATKEQKLEKIITQKWIAIYPLGTEAWSEQRRTGYPRFYPSVNAAEPSLQAVGASRLPFAPSEAENSPENYAKAVQLLGGPDNFGTKLWWDVKTNKPAW